MRTVEGASFRDPAGFIFYEDGAPFRFVAEAYRSDWEALAANGLLEALQKGNLIIPYEIVADGPAKYPGAIAVLRPTPIPLITYPYEWCFTQLKDAALLTLQIQKASLDRGMSLKDASAYNIQFLAGRPVHIDTLSFETYREGAPWPAYRQFCRHFLAPLALMAKVHPECGSLLRSHLDGIPLDLASRTLPAKTRLDSGLAIHLHLHARAENLRSAGARSATVSKTGLYGLLDSLERTIRKLKWEPSGTVWGDYYSETNYSDRAMAAKRELVERLLAGRSPRRRVIWDLGANTGEFSEIAARHAEEVVAWDVDPAAVEKHYRKLQSGRFDNILPLIQDLTNPSPALGWAHEERASFVQRSRADLVLALALVHHLAIGNNVPLPRIAHFFSRLAPELIIEFVPKEDSQVQRLLSSREDIFDDFTSDGFEAAFSGPFELMERVPVEGTKRVMYQWKRRNQP